ncbi:MAG: response regulator transcription factor, partial [Vulcanimicrobiaceae bacterium]
PLEPPDHEILAQAAVIGRTFSLELLQTTLGWPREAILPALRRARDLQLVAEEAAGGFSFRHALTREVIYANFLATHARELHRRIARTLEEMPEERRSVEALAYHWWAAGDAAKAALFGEHAGDAAAAVFAHEDAIRYYRYGLDSVAAGSLDEARLHRKMGNAHAAAGNHAAARDAHARAKRLFCALGCLADECDCAGLLAVDLQRLGDPNRVAPLEELMARVDRNEHAAMWSALGVRAALLSPLPARAVHVRTLLTEVEPYIGPEDSLDRLRFHGARAELLRATFAADEYALELETTLGIATRLGRVDAKANILANAAHTFTNFGRPEIAGAYFDQAISFAQLHRHTGTLSLIHAWKALHLFLTGELEAARESVRAALHIATDHVLTKVNAAAWGTLVGLSLDDEELTERCYDERLVDSDASDAWLVYLAAGFAAHLESQGRRADAQRLLHRSLEKLDCEAGLVLTLLAVARLGAPADFPAARSLLVRGCDARDAFSQAALPLFDALVERRSGNRAGSVAAADEAAEAFRRLGYPLLEAEAHELAGRLEIAAAHYRARGAARALQRLSLATAPAKAGKLSPGERARGGLTPREGEVAALVTRGLSNAEIAERLALSTKGVEKHLGAIYRKTGLTSRARLVTFLLGGAGDDPER